MKTETPEYLPAPSSRPPQSSAVQETIVRDHFKAYSNCWGGRYAGRPSTMADLDLVLRRENLHALLHPIVDAADRVLKVLDVGCGAGNVLDGIPRERIRVTGMDFVPQMVQSAAAAHPDDCFLVGDAARLPVAAGSVDIVTCLGTLEYVVEPAQALAGFAVALRPGGWALVSFPNSHSLFRKLVRAERAALAICSRLRDRMKGRHAATDAAPPYRHTQWSIAQATRLLAEAGLHVDAIRCNTYGPWGRPGRLKLAVTVSDWLSRKLHKPGILAHWLAGTLVMRARKSV